MLVLGAVAVLIPNCPARIAAIVCVAIAVFTAVAVVKAGWAAETVSETHERVAQRTQFIKLLTVETETLMTAAKTPDAKIATKKVYEALRYSDPMSSEALGEIEAELAEKFRALEAAVTADQGVTEAAESLLETLAERNRKCKAMK